MVRVRTCMRPSSLILTLTYVHAHGQVLPPFCISVSDPYKPCLDKLAAEGVIAYNTNGEVAEVRA